MLRTLPDRGWLNGLDNLVRIELARWWGRRVWWKQLLRWTTIINVAYALISLAMSKELPADQSLADMTVLVFFGLGFASAGIGIIVANQGSIIGERQLGTAAWIMSKPASRAAFVLAKFIGVTVGFLSIIVAQSVLAYWNVSHWVGRALPAAGYAAGIGAWLLTLLFYLALVLALGTMLGSRAGVAGTALAVMFVGQNMKDLSVFQHFGPFRMNDLAVSFVAGQPPAPGFLAQVLTTVLAIIVMVALAVWRFERQDL